MAISESRFNMWRAVIAMMHADDVVQPHEINFALENMRNLPLSERQRQTLLSDMEQAGNIQDFFVMVTTRRDKEDFFHLARALAWSDGDFDEREEAILSMVRALPSNGADVVLLESAMHSFRDIYIDGGGEQSDPSVLAAIKTILNARAA